MSLMACMNIPVMDGISNFHSRFALTNAVARIQLYKIGISSSGLTNRLPLLLDPVVFHYISGSLSCGSQQASPLTIRPYIPSTIRAFTSFSYINTYNAPTLVLYTSALLPMGLVLMVLLGPISRLGCAMTSRYSNNVSTACSTLEPLLLARQI